MRILGARAWCNAYAFSVEVDAAETSSCLAFFCAAIAVAMGPWQLLTIHLNPTAEETAMADLSLRAFASLGCAVWGRVDLMRDAGGDFQVLEVNTVPGMTSHSLVPMGAAAMGMDVPALVARIIELSLREVR